MKSLIVWAALAALTAASAVADPLSKKADIDFFRDVASRDLAGLAARADGRLIAGPTLKELAGASPAELLWCMEDGGKGSWLVGTGPAGKIFTVKIDAAAGRYDSRLLAKLDDDQVFALKRLPNGDILAGTSPKGHLVLLRGGKIISQVRLPADSIFDLEKGTDGTVLAGTGNPGRIYTIDVAKFTAAGLSAATVDDEASLALHGIHLFGSISDRNVRRLARLTDGRWVAGSSPLGNVYAFPAGGGAPLILEENRDAEVTDFLPEASGSCLAAIVYSGPESHVEPARPKDPSGLPPPALQEKFTGRSVLVRFPANGFPDILTARAGGTLYRLARHGAVIVAAGGEQGDLVGYDTESQMALNFGGSSAARLNGIAPLSGSDDRYLVLHNNAPGFAILDFAGHGERRAETRNLDLGQPATVGAVRFDRLRGVGEAGLKVDLKISNGSDEREGWSPWLPLASQGDGWRRDEVRGRYFKLRVSASADATAAEFGRGAIYYLPQNRRPQLQEFHFLTPNYGIIPPADTPLSPLTTLGQVVQGPGDNKDKTKDRLMAAQVLPSLGNQVAFWTVTSPTGDNLVSTLSIRREGETNWIDIAVDTRDSFAQFDVSHLPEGVYVTRLVARENAPRPAGDRLSASFETDDLIVDHTPPALISVTGERRGDRFIVKVHGRDALSLLDSLEADFNNGFHDSVDQPADGVRDGREETFVLDEPLARVTGATTVELSLYDAAGNGASTRIPVSVK